MLFLTMFNSEHAEKNNYGVVDRFVGHGVGTVFHSEPIIYHHSKYFAYSDYHTLQKPCRWFFINCKLSLIDEKWMSNIWLSQM